MLALFPFTSVFVAVCGNHLHCHGNESVGDNPHNTFGSDFLYPTSILPQDFQKY